MAIPFAIALPPKVGGDAGLTGLAQLGAAFAKSAQSYYNDTTEIANDHATIGASTKTEPGQRTPGAAAGSGSTSQQAANNIALRESKFGSTKLSTGAQQQLRSTGAKVGRSRVVPNRSGQNRNRRRDGKGNRVDNT